MKSVLLAITTILLSVLILVNGQCSPTSEYKCQPDTQVDKCIPKAWKCDGDKDCELGDDEAECSANGECSDVEFKCVTDGKCIPQRWHCDGDIDCEDQSDEDAKVCKKKSCSDEQLQCSSSGQCLPKDWKCDGQKDCSDGEDELGCLNKTCAPDEFSCDARCITTRWQCDGDVDCLDGTDEKGCPPVTCTPDQFTCGNTSAVQCIPTNWKCDGAVDCHDQSDELNCTESTMHFECHKTEFKCDDGRCIHKAWKCDGEADCLDNSDEHNCQAKTCDPNKFMCVTSQTCIPSVYTCDGTEDCNDGSDEISCECSLLDQFDCGSHCISKDKVCDGNHDCANKKDEQGCTATRNPCGEDKGGCAHTCNAGRNNTAICSCRLGFSLSSDGKQCEDIDECSTMLETGVCSNHMCKNTLGSYTCRCHDGYNYDTVEAFCRVLTSIQPKLMFANRLDIRELNLITLEYKQVLPNTTNSVALDMDMIEELIFWTDHAHESIQVTDQRTSKTTVLLNTSSISTPDGLAFDWIHKNLYWTDTGHNNIGVIHIGQSSSSSGPKTLLTEQDEPRAIVVDPITTMRLYYTDWGSNPHIGSAGLDGTDQRQVFRGSEVAWPNGLTLDLLHSRLYWVDAKLHILSSIHTSGREYTRIPTHLSDLSHPFAITLFEDTLYWTDWHTDAIYRANKFNATGASIMAAGLHSPMDIHVVHPSKQPEGANRCKSAHCTHICLPALGDGQYVCACPDHMELMDDRNSCVDKQRVTSSTGSSSSSNKESSGNGKNAITSDGSSSTTTSSTTASSMPITSDEGAIKATTDKKSPTGHIMLAVMLILVAVAVVIAMVCFVIYRKYSRRASRSMNFDNPVYKKTTDEDKVSLSRQDSFYIDAPAQPYVDA